MRPEYIEAVEAARWGWSYWLMTIVPPAMIWLSAVVWFLPQHMECGVGLGKFSVPFIISATFVHALVLSWALILFWVNYVEWVKGRLAQTPDEWMDWSADTHVVFAPVTAVFYAIYACVPHAVAAHAIGFVASRFLERRRQRAVRQVA